MAGKHRNFSGPSPTIHKKALQMLKNSKNSGIVDLFKGITRFAYYWFSGLLSLASSTGLFTSIFSKLVLAPPPMTIEYGKINPSGVF